MATTQIDTVIRHLRRAALRQQGAGWTDAQLLASFIDHKDEVAFEAVVRRHGPMVFGVCRRVVGNHHDAEDAFQATFLVLARKASSVRPRAKLANWLHGVALRTALKAKSLTARRRGRELQVTHMSEPETVPQDQWREWQSLLDQELTGLPENYRLPILLCDLEGRRIKEAAQQLGWPQGTLAGRLARGRKLLARRLAKRGGVLSAGSLAAVVSQNVASATVPTSLVSSTVKAAMSMVEAQTVAAGVVSAKVAALTEGVMKSMMLTKLSNAAAGLLVLCICGLGIGGLSLVGLLPMSPAAEAQECASPKRTETPRHTRKTYPVADLVVLVEATYPVADLVVPIPGLDCPPGNEAAKKTKESWLIQKITSTVARETWAERGGPGTIRYQPTGMVLVVNQSAQIHHQLRELLNTMRRAQDVQVRVEMRTLAVSDRCLRGLQARFPELRDSRKAVLEEKEVEILMEAASKSRSKSTAMPRVTTFSGQTVELTVSGLLEAKLKSTVGANLCHVDLQVNALVHSKMRFQTMTQLREGTTVVLLARQSEASHVLFLITPSVVFNLDDTAVFLPPKRGTGK
jgi:RNA polymerase sigma factor (sigma-70 family)